MRLYKTTAEHCKKARWSFDPQEELNDEPVNWDWENEADKENDESFLEECFEEKEL